MEYAGGDSGGVSYGGMTVEDCEGMIRKSFKRTLYLYFSLLISFSYVPTTFSPYGEIPSRKDGRIWVPGERSVLQSHGLHRQSQRRLHDW